MSDNSGVLLEDIDNKLNAIMEGRAAMSSVPARLDSIDTRLEHLESDMTIVKTVLTDHSVRIAKLETQ